MGARLTMPWLATLSRILHVRRPPLHTKVMFPRHNGCIQHDNVAGEAGEGCRWEESY